MLHEGIYQGWVSHQRYQPSSHDFRYPLAMLMVDVDAVESVFKRSRLWSMERFNLISFHRKDYLGPSDISLREAVCRHIYDQIGEHFTGRIMMLTHPRYLGIIFNPVSFYFCYNTEQQLEYVIAEITNTPWNERHAYVLAVNKPTDSHVFAFEKRFHISPFMPMNVDYLWRFNLDPQKMKIVMQVNQDGKRQFEVISAMQAKPLSTVNMRGLPVKYPLQTAAVVMRIYWQAFRLWLKRVPFYSHPDTHNDKPADRGKNS